MDAEPQRLWHHRVPDLPKSPGKPSDAFAVRQQYQLHSMQVGAADAIVSEMIDHLRATGAWDDTLLVVLGDHGTSFTLPDIWRKVTDANRDEVYRMGMFIKAPGQTEGEIRDDPAETIDVMPSIADLLDARTDWEFDGHSLYAGSAAHTHPKVSEDVEAVFAIADHRAQSFPNGDDWIGLAAVGDNGDLVGTRVDDHGRGQSSAYRVRLDRPEVLSHLPWADGRYAGRLAGQISSDDGERPPGCCGGERPPRRRCRGLPSATATRGSSPCTWPTSTAQVHTTWSCTRWSGGRQRFGRRRHLAPGGWVSTGRDNTARPQRPRWRRVR